MEETKLESLFRQPLMLIVDSKSSANEVDSHVQECRELCSRLETLNSRLCAAVNMVRHGNPRFCEAPTQCIVDETSRTLENCCLLLGKCRRGGFLKRVLSITSAAEFRKANASVEDAIANVKWLLESVVDEESGSFIGMPPITSAFPIRSVIWSLLSKLQGGSPELKEAATSDLATMSRDTEQNGQFIIEEGGVPLLLKILHDGTPEGKIKAATTLGNLAISKERVRKMVQQGVVPACVRVLEKGQVAVQAKVTWAVAEMISKDPEIQEELGDAKAVVYITVLMFDTCENLSYDACTKAGVPLQVLLDANLRAKKGVTISEMPGPGVCKEKSLSISEASEQLSDGFKPSKKRGAVSEMPSLGACKEKSLSISEASEELSGSSKPSKCAGGMLYHGSTSRDTCSKEGGKSLEFKHELKVQVTRALWLLAANNVANSRRITETRAMLGFATLMEKEEGEVQSNVIMAVMELAASAERDMDFRKFAFKLNLPAAKAIVNQLHRLIVDESVGPFLQLCCIKAVGSLAKAFTSKEDRVIRALVLKLSISDRIHPGVTAATLNTLLKFTDEDNYLAQEHSLAFLEVPGLPYLVQLVVYDKEKRLQAPAILLLSQLALRVGRIKSEAFQEAAALSVLKSAKTAASKIEQSTHLPLKDRIFEAICHLEFGQAGKHRMHSSHAQISTGQSSLI